MLTHEGALVTHGMGIFPDAIQHAKRTALAAIGD